MTLVYLEAIVMVALALASVICLYTNLALHQKKYAQHAVFHQTKAQKRLREHPYLYGLFILLFVAVNSWFLTYYLHGFIQQFFFGWYISLLSIILGGALGGIAIFLYTIRNPEKISGQTVLEGKRFRAVHTQPALMACLFLLLALFLIHQTPFILGGLVAVIGVEFFLLLSTLRG